VWHQQAVTVATANDKKRNLKSNNQLVVTVGMESSLVVIQQAVTGVAADSWRNLVKKDVTCPALVPLWCATVANDRI